MARSGKPSQREMPMHEEQAPSGRKLIVTFRMPGDLGDTLRARANRKGVSFNELAVSMLQDLVGWFDTPYYYVDELEADRKALGLDQREYFRHLLGFRYDAVHERGPGFDARRGQERKPSKE